MRCQMYCLSVINNTFNVVPGSSLQLMGLGFVARLGYIVILFI